MFKKDSAIWLYELNVYLDFLFLSITSETTIIIGHTIVEASQPLWSSLVSSSVARRRENQSDTCWSVWSLYRNNNDIAYGQTNKIELS